MDALWSECIAHGYAAPPVSASDATESPFVQQLRQLMELSRLVEAATLRLTSLQAQASFEDLVNPMALERKAALLRDVEARTSAVVAGKDKILAFVQGQHARHGSLAIEASRQAVVVELFDRMQREAENAETLLAGVEWGASDAAVRELERIESTLTALTQYQARHQRALEASENLTNAIEQAVKK
jgi:hypothetical protein